MMSYNEIKLPIIIASIIGGEIDKFYYRLWRSNMTYKIIYIYTFIYRERESERDIREWMCYTLAWACPWIDNGLLVVCQ